jgi:hypothetical protein
MKWFALIPCLFLLALSRADAAPSFSYPWPDYSVVPILFSPTDWDVNSAEVQREAAALRGALGDIQRFYARELGGRSFLLNDLQLVQGSGAKESYDIFWNGGNIYTNGIDLGPSMEALVVQELYSRGFPTPPGQNEDGYTVLIFVKGAGGYAGGRELGSADAGWALLGDWAIDSIEGAVAEGDYWWSGARLQTGAAAHELGHAFGLPHPDSYGGNNETSVMGEWWRYPNVGLNNWEIDALRTTKAPFFTTAIPEPSSLMFAAAALLLLLAMFRVPRSSASSAMSRQGFALSALSN